MCYLLARSAGSVRGVQLKQEQHQDPQEVGGAQRNHQLDQHRQSTMFRHVRQRVSKHVNNPRHDGVHVSQGIIRDTAGLTMQVVYNQIRSSTDFREEGTNGGILFG